jgi:hypothetical protein
VKPIYLIHSQTAGASPLFRAEEILRANGFQVQRHVIGQAPLDTHMHVAILAFPHLKVGCDVAAHANDAFKRGAEVFEVLPKTNTIQRINQRSLKDRTLDVNETIQMEAFRTRDRTEGLDAIGPVLKAHYKMHTAVSRGDLDEIKSALRANIDWTKPSAVIGTSWLMYYLNKKQFSWGHQQADVVQLFLDAGGSPHEINSKGENTVMMACSAKNLRTLGVLLSHGVDPNHQDQDGWSALMRLSLLSTRYKSFGMEPDQVDYTCADMAKLLIEHGADPNLKPNGSANTPLRLAAGKGLVQTCRVLVEAGAKIDLRDSKMRRASDAAKEGNHKECVDYLLELERVDDARVILQVDTPDIAPLAPTAPRRARL